MNRLAAEGDPTENPKPRWSVFRVIGHEAVLATMGAGLAAGLLGTPMGRTAVAEIGTGPQIVVTHTQSAIKAIAWDIRNAVGLHPSPESPCNGLPSLTGGEQANIIACGLYGGNPPSRGPDDPLYKILMSPDALSNANQLG